MIAICCGREATNSLFNTESPAGIGRTGSTGAHIVVLVMLAHDDTSDDATNDEKYNDRNSKLQPLAGTGLSRLIEAGLIAKSSRSVWIILLINGLIWKVLSEWAIGVLR